MKKFSFRALACLGAFGAFVSSAFAEGAAVTIDTANVTSLGTAMSTWATTVMPIVLSVAGAFVAFYMLRLALRLLKGIASGSK